MNYIPLLQVDNQQLNSLFVYFYILNNLDVDENVKNQVTKLIDVMHFGDADKMLFEYDKNDWNATLKNYLDDRFSGGNRLAMYNELNEIDIPLPDRSVALRCIWQGDYGQAQKIMDSYKQTQNPSGGEVPKPTGIPPSDPELTLD